MLAWCFALRFFFFFSVYLFFLVIAAFLFFSSIMHIISPLLSLSKEQWTSGEKYKGDIQNRTTYLVLASKFFQLVSEGCKLLLHQVGAYFGHIFTKRPILVLQKPESWNPQAFLSQLFSLQSSIFFPDPILKQQKAHQSHSWKGKKLSWLTRAAAAVCRPEIPGRLLIVISLRQNLLLARNTRGSKCNDNKSRIELQS